MKAHSETNERRCVLRFDVNATDVFDLRVPDALAEVRRNAGEPFGEWQSIAASGGEPSSWRARDWMESCGAKGLIDPSRKEPGLWDLVLFRWNVADAPTVS